jgi:signal peptide peptidase SppA
MEQRALEAMIEAAGRGLVSLAEPEGATSTSGTVLGSMAAAAQGQAPAGARGGSVGVIPIRGTIRHHAAADIWSILFGSSASTTEQISSELRAMLADETIGAIVLDIDSPGGTSYGITELSTEIFNARGKKPIVALADDVMASAAYWIGSAADALYATPSALVGSIGVYILHEDISKMADDVGVKVTFVSAGKYKTEGNQFEPLDDEARGHLQELVDDTYDQFVKDVARNRGVADAAVRQGYGQGRVLPAKKAKALGMIDGIYTLDEAIARSVSIAPGKSGLTGAAAEADANETHADDDGIKRLNLIRWRALQAHAEMAKGET